MGVCGAAGETGHVTGGGLVLRIDSGRGTCNVGAHITPLLFLRRWDQVVDSVELGTDLAQDSVGEKGGRSPGLDTRQTAGAGPPR